MLCALLSQSRGAKDDIVAALVCPGAAKVYRGFRLSACVLQG